jgi:hypothetical protein
MADDYFSHNFYGSDVWETIPVEKKEMLIETAENDISMALKSPIDSEAAFHSEKPYTCVQMAVFEWALYLHNNKAKLLKKLNSTTAGLASVEVDGIGKETYTSTGTTSWYFDCLFRSRAGQFLSLIHRDVRIIR